MSTDAGGPSIFLAKLVFRVKRDEGRALAAQKVTKIVTARDESGHLG